MAVNKPTVAILFGGRSTEHEVSIITGLQVVQNADRDKYNVLPVYVTKEGKWVTGDERLEKVETYRDLSAVAKDFKNSYITPDTLQGALVENPESTKGLLKKSEIRKIDVAILCFHGGSGEDGGVQGLLDMAGIPYTGCGVLGSALCMDKISTKLILKSAGVPVVKGIYFLREDWDADKKSIIQRIEKELSYPIFIKPSNSGSTIGIGAASNKKELEEVTEVAKFYDRRILAEEGVKNPKETNVSVMGYKNLVLSEFEQPVSSGKFLSFQDKYLSGGGKSEGMASTKRIIPSPIKDETRKKIGEYAKQAYKVLDCSGLVRIDFLLSQDEKQVYLNEVNTIPGSMSFYLWEPAGVPFNKMIDNLIEIAKERQEDRSKTVRTFQSNILENFSGAKGAKGQ